MTILASWLAGVIDANPGGTLSVKSSFKIPFKCENPEGESPHDHPLSISCLLCCDITPACYVLWGRCALSNFHLIGPLVSPKESLDAGYKDGTSFLFLCFFASNYYAEIFMDE